MITTDVCTGSAKEYATARILIAEDDPLVASLLGRGLTLQGYETEIVDDGERARALSLFEDFDLLILDIGLPTLDGFEILRALRSSGRHMPVIVVTGMGEREAAATLDIGANVYVTKPFTFETLLMLVRAMLLDQA